MAGIDAKQPVITPVSNIQLQRISSLSDASSLPRGVHKKYRCSKSLPAVSSLPKENGDMDTPKSNIPKLHPSFRQVIFPLAIYLGLCTLCFCFFKEHIKGKKTYTTLDAIYLCVVTMTTVGYGDLVPNSVPTKLLACAFVFAGMALVALILSKAADYLVEKQQVLLIKALKFSQEVGEFDARKKIKSNRLKYKILMIVIFLFVLIIVGTVFLSKVEGFDLVDSFYCVCCTITTLGYGDKSFTTVAGRIFAVFWILTSTICLALFFLYIAELNTEHRQQSLVELVLNRRMTRTDLEQADRNGDHKLSADEFIIYKLKEMGKISQEDIALVLKEFSNRDENGDGNISASDIKLAQFSQMDN